ncbi:MBG domain-containing protein [Lacticaseibacillus nasuensis]|uniref:MBG domain-containing protein n=1 Tax=Lacticaseibacillus nasuensis TaxID=944671 RepID=UPI0022477689|nr:MBG domain-containing protein [Lacticaseibacillus nasuensis]MCX2455144.1 KxYKxGKxW signal peptide domain-containing protein [Lacticaseibacillus nasuensis]
MNKREAFRRALTDTKHRKHMRKSGKHWLVRGVTALTLGLMMAQPVVSVAAVVDADPQTEAPASEAPAAEEEVPAAEVSTPEEAPVEENVSEPAPENGNDGATETVTPEADSQPVPEVENEQATPELPVITQPSESVVKEEAETREADLAIGEVDNVTMVYGELIDSVQFRYTTADGLSREVWLFPEDIDITDEAGNIIDHTQRMDVGSYQISPNAETLDRYHLGPINLTPGELVITPKQVNITATNLVLPEGSSFDDLGFLSPGFLDGGIGIQLANGVAIEDLSVGRYTLTWELYSDDGKHNNYEIETPEFELTIIPEDNSDWLSVGSDKEYDGTANLPDDILSVNDLLSGKISPEDLEFSSDYGDTWESEAPVNADSYRVRVTPARQAEIQEMVQDEYGVALYDGYFWGWYDIYLAAITDAPEKDGDLFIRLPSGKQFDGTSKLGAKVEHNIALDYEITEEHLMYRALEETDDEEEELPFASREAIGWQAGAPTEVGEYELALRDEVVDDILEANPNHWVDEGAITTTYTITPGEDTDSNTGGNGGSNGSNTGSNTGNAGSATTAPTPDSVAYVSQTSGHTLPLATTNSQADGTLPSTGQRNQTLLSMLGMTLLGTLGLAGWYKRHQAK